MQGTKQYKPVQAEKKEENPTGFWYWASQSSYYNIWTSQSLMCVTSKLLYN